MAGYIDRRRVEATLRDAALDALILTQPEALAYATGAPSASMNMWRRSDMEFVVLPRDPALPIALVAPDFVVPFLGLPAEAFAVFAYPCWVEHGPGGERGLRGRAMPERPETYSADVTLGLLKRALETLGLLGGALAVDERCWSVQANARYIEKTGRSAPAAGAAAIDKIRAVKTPEEIALLRRGCQCAEAGLRAVLDGLDEGMRAIDIERLWRDGAVSYAKDQFNQPVQTWSAVSAGPHRLDAAYPIRPGDLVKADVGCLVNGYASDSARTFVLGAPSRRQQAIMEAFCAAFDAGLETLEVGAALSDTHRKVCEVLASHGVDQYVRGHFGHSLGGAHGVEEWPYISAQSEARLEQNMVLAFEIPWYADGEGVYMIEDQILITASGPQSMNALERRLLAVGAD